MKRIEMRQIHGTSLAHCVEQINVLIDEKEIDPEEIVSIQEITSANSDAMPEATQKSFEPGHGLYLFVRTPSNLYAKIDE